MPLLPDQVPWCIEFDYPSSVQNELFKGLENGKKASFQRIYQAVIVNYSSDSVCDCEKTSVLEFLAHGSLNFHIGLEINTVWRVTARSSGNSGNTDLEVASSKITMLL